MYLMPFRYQALQEAMHGYEKTGMPLVVYDGTALKPAGVTDDPGLYDFVPRLANLLGLTLDQTLNVFLGGLTLGAMALGSLACLLYFRTWPARILATLALLMMALVSLKVGDLYVVAAALAMAGVPWLLFLSRKRGASLPLAGAMAALGAAAGLAHYVRSHSGTALVIFAALLALFYVRAALPRRLMLIASLGAGMLLPLAYVSGVVTQRDAYLAQTGSFNADAPKSHPLWHSVYIGLGYIHNEYGIQYQDEVAAAKVRAVSPGAAYMSAEYEAILRREVLQLIKTEPFFVVQNLFAKLGVVALYLIAFANLGLVAAVRYPKAPSLELAFWAALGFSALFGLLVVPGLAYLLGFAALATLYGVVSINHVIERRLCSPHGMRLEG